MKQHLLTLLFIIGVYAVHAQPHAFTEEFVKYPDIEYFRVEMEGDSVSFILVHFKEGTTTADGNIVRPVAYDFRFEGDHYLFRQRYDSAMLELSPADVDSSKILNKRKKWALVCGLFYPDTVVYEYQRTVNWMIHAAYRPYADFKLLGTELQHHAADIALEQDSILFFQALIGQDGNMEAMELIQGDGGKYTDEIIGFFKSMQGAWNPFVKDGRLYRSLTDICVRLGSDGKVRTSHSLSLRTPKVEIKDYTMMGDGYYSYRYKLDRSD